MTRDVLALACVVLGIPTCAVGAAILGGTGAGLVVLGCGLVLLGILFGLSS